MQDFFKKAPRERYEMNYTNTEKTKEKTAALQGTQLMP